MIPIDKVENIVSRFNELETILAKPDLKKDEFVNNSKEYSNLNDIISYAKDYLKVLEDLNDTNLDGVLLSDNSACLEQYSNKCTNNYGDYPTIVHPVYLGKSCPAYILTREGARKLINKTIPISMPVETFFNQLNFNKTISIGRTKKPLVEIIA